MNLAEIDAAQKYLDIEFKKLDIKFAQLNQKKFALEIERMKVPEEPVKEYSYHG